MALFEKKISEVSEKCLNDVARLNKEIFDIQQDNNNLKEQVIQKEKKIKELEEKIVSTAHKVEKEWMIKLEDKVNFYEQKINEYNS